MKLILTAIAILASATAAQAQGITHMARLATETIALSDLECQFGRPWLKSVVLTSYGPQGGTSYGCYSMSFGVVKIQWFRVGSGRPLPDSIPLRDFEKV